MTPQWVLATDLGPGMRVHRWDTGALIYTIEQVDQVDAPDAGVHVRGWCRHVDGGLHPHYWLPAALVAVIPEEG